MHAEQTIKIDIKRQNKVYVQLQAGPFLGLCLWGDVRLDLPEFFQLNLFT
jgi:hypothetical protein